ncbi:MAG TPA: hypothetical protein ENK74_06205 [Nitratifractor sp.]|jgi:small-conductance mechanosensitive channel|nr:hypothetical protein [Nitratifractor sp.]
MVHILKKIADWIIEHESKEATDCTVPDEIVQEWLDDVNEHLKRMEQNGKKGSERYLMLQDIKKRVKQIQKIRAESCNLKAE